MSQLAGIGRDDDQGALKFDAFKQSSAASESVIIVTFFVYGSSYTFE
jgi:hypothetical protein